MLAVVCLCLFVQCSLAKDVHVFVDPSGSDTNNGLTIHSPVRTLSKAVTLALGPAYNGYNLFIELLPGYHYLDHTLQISHHHGNLLTMRSHNGSEVHVIGGRRIPANSFKPVTDQSMIDALPNNAHHHVRYVHLPSMNITNYGAMYSYGFARKRSAPLEVFYNGQPLRMARWPNEGFINIVNVLDGTNGHRFKYNSARPKTWKYLKDLWAYGYWYWSWADLSIQVASLDAAKMTVTLSNTSLIFGMRRGYWGETPLPGHPKQGGYFRFINVLSELDVSGEYYLDRATGNLYAWLSEDGSVKSTDVVHVSMLKNCIQFQRGVRNVVLSNFIVEACRVNGIVGLNVQNIQMKNMEIRNTGSVGIALGGDSRGCYISKTSVHDSDGGISVTGGNRKLLESGGNIIEDCEIYRFSREGAVGRNAVSLRGVGNLVRYSKMYTGQYTAVIYAGNDHTMEYNHIYDTCMNASDCGALHTGRDWTYRGNVIRYNLVHHTLRYVPGADVRGVMLDDQVSSTTITNNVFYDNEVHVNVGGGRDNVISDNVMYNCTKSSMQVDGRGLNRDDYRDYINKKLHDMPYTGTLWASRYPALARIDSGNRTLPEGNQIHRNLIYNTAHREFIHGFTGWLNNPKYYNVTDNGFSYGAGDHYNIKVGDLRLKCHAKEWANYVNFPQVITPNDVGPRFDVGPTFNKIVRKLVQLHTSSDACTTHAPMTNSPMPAYLPDGSGQKPWFSVSHQGCWLHVEKCSNDPKAVGTYRDTYGEQHAHALDNDAMCFQRAVDRWHRCGSKHNEEVAAIFGPTGATTFAGDGCFMARYGCPKHGGPSNGHVTNGKIFRDVYAEQHSNGTYDQAKCLARASAQWIWCGSHPNHPVTSLFRPTGTSVTVGAGCWIKVVNCPKDPSLKPMFYDAFGASNAFSDDDEQACFQRAEDYWMHCGLDVRYPVTAYYRPKGKSYTYPKEA